MRRSNTETLGTAIQRFLKSEGIDKKLREVKVVRQWEDIIGRSVARATESIAIRNGVLHVKLNSPIVRQELSMIKSEIVKRMNQMAGMQVVTSVQLW